jgi:plastocyanin
MARYLGLATEIPFSYTVTPGGTVQGTCDSSEGPETVTAPGGAEDDAEGEEDVGTGAAGGPQEERGRTGPGDDRSRAPEVGPERTPGGEPGQGTGSPAGSGGLPSGAEVEIVPTPEPPPLVNVIRVTKMTTRKRERRVYHVRWEWDFGDGERWVDDDPRHTKVSVTHTYDTPGTYTVRALSLANDGRRLRELSWTVEAGRDGPDGTGEGLSFTFEAETIVEPEVVLHLGGPVKWITGRPARFVLTAEVSRPPHTRRQVIRAYPGWSFDVVWEKPGRFEVRAAVTVRQSYEFPERRLTLWNTYVVVTEVEVFVPGLTE